MVTSFQLVANNLNCVFKFSIDGRYSNSITCFHKSGIAVLLISWLVKPK